MLLAPCSLGPLKNCSAKSPLSCPGHHNWSRPFSSDPSRCPSSSSGSPSNGKSGIYNLADPADPGGSRCPSSPSEWTTQKACSCAHITRSSTWKLDLHGSPSFFQTPGKHARGSQQLLVHQLVHTPFSSSGHMPDYKAGKTRGDKLDNTLPMKFV